jgi:hypothetical protein
VKPRGAPRLATGFAILLGFVVFLAFESFDQSRSGAETEAVVVAQQFRTAQFMPDAVRGDLADGLVCYGRSVVDQEWPRMETAAVAEGLNPWGVELFRVLERADPKAATEQSAFDDWLDQTTDREQGRIDRLHGAEGVIPTAVAMERTLTLLEQGRQVVGASGPLPCDANGRAP